MFKLHRPSSKKLADRIDFKLSNLQALQVPPGWDKLLVSVVSVETGKTLVKSGKASVRNGSCQWTETLSESVSIPQNDISKDVGDPVIRLIIAMGSGRFGILGDATVNLANYRGSKTAISVSLPLKKCNHGTILQFKIHCLLPRTKRREEQLEDTVSPAEDASVDYDEIENKSDVSDSSYTRSVASSSSSHLDQTGELNNRDQSFSASGSRYSFDSMEGSSFRENSSPQRNSTGTADNQIGRQDSTGSQNNFPHGSYSFNDSSRSNHSSFNSKASVPRSHVQNQRDDFFYHVSHSVRNSVSSKDLMDSAETKIEELQAESKMWERKSRKLMTDLETVQKVLSEQSEHQTSLEMDLSESRRECNGLKQKIEQLKITLEESMEKQRANEDSKFESKEMNNVQRELEYEVKYLSESNANLDIQLKKTQESNIELVSILQELEDTIEKQKVEIETLSKLHSENENADKSHCGHGENDMKKATSCDPEADQHVAAEPENMNLQLEVLGFHVSQKSSEKTIQDLEDPTDVNIYRMEADQSLRNKALEDHEAEWKEKLAAKEEEIITLEAKLSEALKPHHSRNEESKDLIGEIEVLKQKIEELEKDCDELTEENLELLHKLKQSNGEIPISGASFNSLSYDISENNTFFAPESEVTQLKALLCSLEDEMRRKEILIEELSNDCQLVQHHELVKNCAELECQLQDSKEKMCCLDGEVSKYHGKAEGLEVEVAALQKKLACRPERTTETIMEDLKISDVHAAAEVPETLSKLHEQIHLCLVNVKKHNPSLSQNSYFNDHSNPSKIPDATKFDNQKEQAEAILKTFLHLKDLVEVEVATCNGKPLEGEASLRMASNDNLNELEAHNLEDSISTSCDQGQGSPQKNSELGVQESDEKVTEKVSEIEKLKCENSLKEHEIKALRDSQRELEAQISVLQSDKRQLEETMQVLLKEGNMSSECMDDIQNQMLVLNSNMDSQVSANKILVRKSSELESSKEEMENHLSELEKENLQLSERICGLEAQVRYLTDKRESSRLELQNSEACTMNLQEEIQKLQNELEAQKVDMKQKLQNIQKKWLESQEKCDHLVISNGKLQTTAESLIEESSTLQKSNIELRNQKVELFERCTVMEAELRESKTLFSSMLVEVRTLEEKYTAMMEEVDSKEKALGLELEALIQDNQKHKEVLVLQENLLNQIYSEKTVEVDKLQREIAHLIEQISATNDEDQGTNPNTILEISRLRADKAMLESSLEELQEKLQLSQRNVRILQNETESKLQAIRNELANSRQNQEVLTADNEKLLSLVEDTKSKEEKHKGIVRGLELKLKASEYERLRVAEEVCSLKEQLEKIPLLLNEIEALRRTLDEVKFDNQRLGASLQIVSADYEESKAEKILSMQKVLSLEKSVSELEGCKHSKIALEEKVLRLEGDLTAREALGAEIAELKNEIARIKRERSEIQRKMKYIEEEKQEYLKRAQSFEEEFKQRNDDKQDNHEPVNETSNHNETKFLQIEAKSSTTAEPQFDLMSKIQLLENELAEALEANEMYKSQLKSMLSDTWKDEDGTAKEGNWSRSLDTQLKDLKERYFHMSLKYAQVETEREQLALKLKATNSGRRWFS